MCLTNLLDGGGELQAQLDDSALDGSEVLGAGQRTPGQENREDGKKESVNQSFR